MPSFFSRPTSFMPGVFAGTTKDLMPPRPALLSTVAHTTTKPPSTCEAPSPLVQKILVPFSTHSLAVEARRVVWIAAASEPALRLGDRHRAPHRRGRRRGTATRKRAFCSGVPAAATAEPPSAGVGMRRYSAGVAPAQLLGLHADLDHAVARAAEVDARRRRAAVLPEPVDPFARQLVLVVVVVARDRAHLLERHARGSARARCSVFGLGSKLIAMGSSDEAQGFEAAKPRALRRCISGRYSRV